MMEQLREALKRTDAIAVPFESDVALFVAAVRLVLDSPQVEAFKEPGAVHIGGDYRYFVEAPGPGRYALVRLEDTDA